MKGGTVCRCFVIYQYGLKSYRGKPVTILFESKIEVKIGLKYARLDIFQQDVVNCQLIKSLRIFIDSFLTSNSFSC